MCNPKDKCVSLIAVFDFDLTISVRRVFGDERDGGSLTQTMGSHFGGNARIGVLKKFFKYLNFVCQPNIFNSS